MPSGIAASARFPRACTDICGALNTTFPLAGTVFTSMKPAASIRLRRSSLGVAESAPFDQNRNYRARRHALVETVTLLSGTRRSIDIDPADPG
jgi:hypothetical protein